ncbi:hypothetical protein VNO78_04036 [Psophocarpus tetragonolobus]|uniref:Uncharacterized protein n=1 Tax=Psophocarpus tetragonolobus TaxID=3891 RepID=A0AAN9RGJ4_PSOTE
MMLEEWLRGSLTIFLTNRLSDVTLALMSRRMAEGDSWACVNAIGRGVHKPWKTVGRSSTMCQCNGHNGASLTLAVRKMAKEIP